jgi:hypothetical protein
MPGRSSKADYDMAKAVGRPGSAGARRVRRIHDYGAITSDAPSMGRYGRRAAYPLGTRDLVRTFFAHLDESPRHRTMAEACLLTWRDGHPIETGRVPTKDRPGKGLKRALVELLPVETLEVGPQPEDDDERWKQRKGRADKVKRDILEDRSLDARRARSAMRSSGINSIGGFVHDVALSAVGEPLAIDFEDADQPMPDVVKLTNVPWNHQAAAAARDAYSLMPEALDLEHHKRAIDEATRDELDRAMSVFSRVEGIRDHPQALAGAIFGLLEVSTRT